MKIDLKTSIPLGVIFSLIPFFTVPISEGKTGFDVMAHDHFISGHVEQEKQLERQYQIVLASDDKSVLARECMGLEYQIDRLQMQRRDIQAHPSLPEDYRNRELQEINDRLEKLEKKLDAARNKRDIVSSTLDSLVAHQ